MPNRPPISRVRLGLVLAVAGPALVLGGVWPWVIPGFAIVVAATLHALHRRGRPLRIPVGLGLAGLAVVATLVQLLPIPGLRAAVAPELHAWVELARTGIDAPGWPSVSPTPVDTGFELVRLVALGGLALVAAQLGWRATARALVLVGVAVATIGLVQHGLGVVRIYGLYTPHHLPSGRTSPALLATFVNPNHQSGLLLVTAFATAAAMLARRGEGRLESKVVLGVALVLQGAALVLSASRAALVSALAAALLAALVASWPVGPSGSRRHGRARAAALAIMGGVALGVIALVAWGELGVMLEANTLDAPTAARLRVTTSAPALLGLSPLVGIGRGAFGDVFPAFDPEPSHVWFSHLECAPLTMLVEWGLLGGALALLLPAWWLHSMRHAGRHDDARARRVALAGLLALALQSLADFSLEFLGVAAPACALAGALSATSRATLSPRQLRGLAIALAGLAVAATPLVPATWAWQQAPRSSSDAAIAARPLSAPLHRLRAREAAAAGDLARVELRARAAVRLQPANVDGWLLLASAARARGEPPAERRAVARALARLHRVASPELVEHLVRRYPAPSELAALAPAASEPWQHLMAGLLVHAPAHADAVAAARSWRAPDDPRPLRHRFELALAREQPALALHHARLWRQLAPRDPHAHLAVARALQAFPEPRTRALREALELALLQVDPHDTTLRGLVEEQLLRALLRPGPPVAPERLRTLARGLRARPTDDATRLRRLALIEPLLVDDLR